MKENERLLSDMTEIANAIAEEAGHNLPYCPSVDLSIFPYVVALTLDRDEMHEYEFMKDENEVLDTLHFLAENGRILSESLADAPMKEIVSYVREHQEEIFKEIRKDCEGYYEEFTGRKFPS